MITGSYPQDSSSKGVICIYVNDFSKQNSFDPSGCKRIGLGISTVQHVGYLLSVSTTQRTIGMLLVFIMLQLAPNSNVARGNLGPPFLQSQR